MGIMILNRLKWRVKQIILLIQTLAEVVAKYKFGSCVIAKLRGQLLHFSFIQKFLHVGFCFGPGDRIFVFLQDCAILHNSRTIADFYRTICLQKPAQFSFFPTPCQKACMLLGINVLFSDSGLEIACYSVLK